MKILKSVVVKTKRTYFVDHKEHKFRILYHQTGSTHPEYHSRRFKTDLLTKDGWVLFADKSDIDFNPVFCPQTELHDQDSAAFVAAMQELIELLY